MKNKIQELENELADVDDKLENEHLNWELLRIRCSLSQEINILLLKNKKDNNA